jgi:hypothetical protein
MTTKFVLAWPLTLVFGLPEGLSYRNLADAVPPFKNHFVRDPWLRAAESM